MRIIKLVAVGMISFSVAQARAQEPSQDSDHVWSFPVARGNVSLVGVKGNTILDRCTKQSDSDQEYCLAWMRLAADNAMSLARIANLPLCIPQEVDSTQLRDVAVKHLRTHPKERHKVASPLVAEAFYNAWPCKPGEKTGGLKGGEIRRTPR